MLYGTRDSIYRNSLDEIERACHDHSNQKSSKTILQQLGGQYRLVSKHIRRRAFCQLGIYLLQGQDFDPTLAMGCILIGEHDIPACHVYLHVDDILVGGPNCDKTFAALDWILDCTVRVRVICQAVKTKPPL
jgi:hypothetical protein